MNIVFSRPNAAFHAYEQSLLRPIARPAPRDTPSLWQRAKDMFGVMMDTARAIAHLALRHRLTRTERRDILIRLKPVEKLTRELLVADAATLLLMTPEGMRLRREARIMALPSRSPPASPLSTSNALITGSRRIATFDPHTLAVMHSVKPVAAIRPDTHDANDPKTWRCAFKVMRLIHPEADDDTPRQKSGPRPRLFSYDDIVSFTPKPRRQTPEREEGAGAFMTRRIEALSRVLEKPDRAIRRVARFFASLPREALDPPDALWTSTQDWYHGHREFFAGRDIAVAALTVLYRLRITDQGGPLPEPG